MIEKFFDPKSVAVIGASNDKDKVGYSFVENLRGGAERKIYPVSLNEQEIQGIPAFRSILEVPDEVDLAIIAVRADIVPQVLSDCGKKNIRNVIIISSGFKEIGGAGAELEAKISAIAAENGIMILGPNCLGVIDTATDLNASFAGQKPLGGSIAFLSQSGALGTAMMDWAIGEGIGFSKFISLGNEAGATEIDFLEFLEDDPRTSAILMYIENVSNGPKFFQTVARITKKKPVVIIKAGMGGHGNLAVMSHTGALAPQASVFIAACKQAGAVTASSLRGFFNIVKVLSQINGTSGPFQRLIILTNGGGPSVIAADLIERSHSLSLLELSNDIKESLRKALPPMAAIGNPIDIIGDALAERYDKALQILSGAENADGVIVILTPQRMTEAEETARVLARFQRSAKESGKRLKIFPVFLGGPAVQAGRDELIKSGLVHFQFPRDVIESLDYLARNAPKLKSPLHPKEPLDEAPVVGEMMGFESMASLLSGYGIFVRGRFVVRKEDLGSALSECGPSPYAMKAMSRDIVHKTESGAVALNINDEGEAQKIWDEMYTKNPGTNIEGVLVQKMETGREVIIGMKRDNTFGPTILFGLGGILAEAIKDTVLRIAPLDKEEALKMMREIKGIKILKGMRGQKEVNFDLLADIVVNLSRLAIEHPEIKEIDLNPVMVTESSATVVDARVMI